MTNIAAPEFAHLEFQESSGEVMVKINSDFTVEYGPNYDPDEAARLFWGSLCQNGRAMYLSRAEVAAALDTEEVKCKTGMEVESKFYDWHDGGVSAVYRLRASLLGTTEETSK